MLSNLLIGFILLVSLFIVEGWGLQDSQWCVEYDENGQVKLTERGNTECPNWGEVRDVHEGWYELHTQVTKNVVGVRAAYLSGVLEGFLLGEQVWQMYELQARNAWGMDPTKPVPSCMNDYMEANLAFSDQLAASNSSRIGQGVALAQAGLDGVLYGYRLNKGLPAMTRVQMAMLHAAGDLEDLVPLLCGGEVRAQSVRDMDCSMLVSMSPSTGELMLSHTTWRSYGLMLRVLKSVELALDSGEPVHILFSSSPGFGLVSKDDFYVVDGVNTTLAVAETTMSVLNHSLYAGLHPQVLLTWTRTVVANLLAREGQDWTSIFSEHVGYSYNNGFAVLDLDAHGLPDGTFWYVEQMPTITEAADLTYRLRNGSFAGFYNVPYLEGIRKISGYNEKEATDGSEYSYWHCARARLFEESCASGVGSVDEAYQIISSNSYTTDPISGGDPARAISSRYDLRQSKPVAFGGVDAKVVGQNQPNCIIARSGPTQGANFSLPPFSFAKEPWNSVYHDGLPLTFNFSPVVFQRK